MEVIDVLLDKDGVGFSGGEQRRERRMLRVLSTTAEQGCGALG